METDGEGGGGGGEAERMKRSELGRLLEAIGSSKVLEKRIPLIKQLEEECCADDLGLILQGLLASWVDSTCSGVSHCTLHRSILQVALKCSDLEITDHLGQFLTLGAKASSWSVKHVQWSAKCIDQSQVTAEEEEHDRLHLEVNSLSLNICTKLLDIAAKCITVPWFLQGLEVAKGEDGHGVKKEECVSAKGEDAFPTLETMAVEVEPAPAHLHLAVGMSPDHASQLLHSNPRRCMHCALEKTISWRRGPDGPNTLCNACGLRFLKGRLVQSNPRHRPSNKHRSSSKVEQAPAHLAVTPSSFTALSQDAPRRWCRCTHCASVNTQRWYRGPDGPGTLCRACWYRFTKGQPPQHNHHRRQYCTSNKHSPCMHCGAEQTPRWLRGPAGPGTLCSACGQRFLIGRLIPVDSNKPRQLLHSNPLRRRCMHCGSENTPRWLKGPDGPGTLCDSCGQKFYKGRLLHYNSRRGSSSKEDSVAGNDVAALAEALPCGVGASLDAFFDNTGSEVPCGKGTGPELADEEEEELEWLSNKDAFPSVETMAVEVEEEASAPDVPRARTKGRRRVTAMETAAADHVTAAEADHGKESMEEQLLPERPPADSPAFSLVSHGPVIKRRRKSEAQTFASIRRTAKAGRAIRAAARLAAMDN